MSIASEISRLQSAKASIKTAIEGQGVTVPSSTTLDGYATLIDSISGGGGGSMQYNSGTLTGDGTQASFSINIGFEPDVVVVYSTDLDYAVAGWTGEFSIGIIKNVATYNMRHNNDTSTSYNASLNTQYNNGYPYGDPSVSYATYGTYSNGVMTISNQGSASAIVRLVTGATYVWEAWKYTS